MRVTFLMRFLVILALLTVGHGFAPAVAADGVVGTGSPESCTEATLDRALAAGGTIRFDCGPQPATITISRTKVITRDTLLLGRANLRTPAVTISGGEATRVFSVTAGVSVTMQGLVISHGAVTDEPGAGISNAGNLSLQDVLLVSNTVTLGVPLPVSWNDPVLEQAAGGAIYNSGVLTIAGGLLESNTAPFKGGGLMNRGTATVGNATFLSNTATAGSGGGMYNTGTMTLRSRTSIALNQANSSSGGGGIYNQGGTMLLDEARVSENRSIYGGGIINAGQMTINHSLIVSNTAQSMAGISNDGTLDIEGSSLLWNRSGSGSDAFGGAISSDGTLSVRNSTLSTNEGGSYGANIHATGGGVTLTNVTLVHSGQGASIYASNGATVKLKNTLVVGGCMRDVGKVSRLMSIITSLGHNLDAGTSCGFNAGGDISNRDPLITPLQTDPWPIPFHMLYRNSPAINAGDNTGCPPDDQVGTRRPQPAYSGAQPICDIGAYEANFGEPYSPTPTGFAIGFDSYWFYISKRGGYDTFGYPVSRPFRLHGFTTQIYQRHVLQSWPDGSVHPVNLLDPDVMPVTSVNFSTFPPHDPAVATAAPLPNTPDYGAAVVRYLQASVPDTWEAQPVGFLSAYMKAAPESAGTLRPLVALEVWGFPTSRPMRDPNNANFIYQRFQRGILHYDATTGVTRGILLADAFKDVLLGQGPADLQQQMHDSPFFKQYCPQQPDWLCRPAELPQTNLSFAFEP